MGSDKGEEKYFRRIEFTRKLRVPCNFCDFSSRRSRYALRPHGQDHETVCMETELDRLRLLTRRMTGKDLDGLSFSELQLLDSRLQDVLVIVQNQKGKVKPEQCLQEKVKMDEYERMCKQKQEARDENKMGRELSAPCKSSGTSSSQERPQKQDGDDAPVVTSMQREFERRNAESVQSEFDRLWLLNERMNGRELDGMTYFELHLLESQIFKGIRSVKDEKLAARMEQVARHLKEDSISPLADEQLDTVKDDHHHRHVSSRFRSKPTLLSVSRKLKRFQKRHRKTMPYIRSV